MRWRRPLGITLLLLTVAALVSFGFWPRPLEVDLASVSRGAMEVVLEQEGRTRLKDIYHLTAPVNGSLIRIEHEPGDTVHTKDVLARIAPLAAEALDPRSQALNLAQKDVALAALSAAEADRQAAEADARHTQAEAERARRLHRQDHTLISAQELDRLQAAERASAARLRSAQFRVEVSHHEVRLVEARLAPPSDPLDPTPGESRTPWLEITAPVDGLILRRHRESAGPVNRGEPLFDIGDPASLEIEVDVLTPDAVRLHPGQPVRLERWGGDEPLTGHVRVVEPGGFTKVSALGVEEQRTWVIVDPDPGPAALARLGDAYRIEAHFIVWHAEDVLKVPASALFREGAQWQVYRVEAGLARAVPVRIGQHNGFEAEVIEGLNEGDQVITHPGDTVRDGTRVTARAPGRSAP